jgi:hypothetical protein
VLNIAIHLSIDNHLLSFNSSPLKYFGTISLAPLARRAVALPVLIACPHVGRLRLPISQVTTGDRGRQGSKKPDWQTLQGQMPSEPSYELMNEVEVQTKMIQKLEKEGKRLELREWDIKAARLNRSAE